MTNISEAPGFLDNPHAPDVFADEASGFFLLGGNVRITFSSYRVNHATSPGPVSRVVIGRLILSLAAAENLHLALADFLERQKALAESAPAGPVTLQ